MTEETRSRSELAAENRELRWRLEEAEETLRAIHSGEVDALVVTTERGEQIYTLQSAERPYRLLVEDMNEGALTITTDGLILYCNRRFAAILKAPLQKVIGSMIEAWVAPADREAFHALLPGNASEIRRGEITLRASDGTPMPTYLAADTLRSDEAPNLVCLVATDLSAQKRSEAIVAAEKLARTILEQAAEAIVVCDEHGRIIRASHAAHTVGGANLLGQLFGAAFPLRRADGQAFSLYATKGGESRRGLEVTLDRDGHPAHLLVSIGSLLDERGERLGFVVTLADITALKQAEAERDRLLAELQEHAVELEERVVERTAELDLRAEQLRLLAGELVHAEERERRRLAQVLHDELQQFLVGARLNLRGLQRRLAERTLAQTAQQVDDLIGEAIQVSRSLTTELAPPVLHELGLAAGLEWLAEWMRERHELAVDVRVDPEANPRTEEIQALLFQAARELLLNTVKHAGVKRASVRMIGLPGHVLQVEVSDGGVGFDVQHVFADRRLSEGYGLFSIRERLQSLGGEMEVESAPGCGTRVALRVPLRRTGELATAVLPETEGIESPALAGDPLSSARPKIRLLVADDHALVRQGLIRLLEQESDIEVAGVASDGLQAVDLARELQPDIVMMDVSMPRLGGIEATRRIRGEMPQVRIIGLTMHEEPTLEAAMRAAGASAYLNKSQPPELLLAVIRTVAAQAA